uniref:Uncharacterized protein n=1 Tax=Myotis myotis TaxID=51298 RepID=A0A7J7ZY42_MYOMY|nr:hypothetical protein mMyoMyo1_009562 [Myotis myotis]
MNGSRMDEEQTEHWAGGGGPCPRPGCSPGKAAGHGGTVTDGPWEGRQRPVPSDRLHLHQLAKGRLHPAASTGPRGDQAASRPPGAQPHARAHQEEGAGSLAGLREEGRTVGKCPCGDSIHRVPGLEWPRQAVPVSGASRCHVALTSSCSCLPPPNGKLRLRAPGGSWGWGVGTLPDQAPLQAPWAADRPCRRR